MVWADFSALDRRAGSRGAQFRLLGGRHKSWSPENPRAVKTLAPESEQQEPSRISAAMLAQARAEREERKADAEARREARASRLAEAREVNQAREERHAREVAKPRKAGEVYVPTYTGQEVKARLEVELDALTVDRAA